MGTYDKEKAVANPVAHPLKLRIRAAWNVLRDRPTIYGVRDRETIRMDGNLNRAGMVICCTVDPDLES